MSQVLCSFCLGSRRNIAIGDSGEAMRIACPRCVGYVDPSRNVWIDRRRVLKNGKVESQDAADTSSVELGREFERVTT